MFADVLTGRRPAEGIASQLLPLTEGCSCRQAVPATMMSSGHARPAPLPRCRVPEPADLGASQLPADGYPTRSDSAICPRVSALAPPNCSHSVADRVTRLMAASGQKRSRRQPHAMPSSRLPARDASLSELGVRADMTQTRAGILCQPRPPGISSQTNAATRCYARLRIALPWTRSPSTLAPRLAP